MSTHTLSRVLQSAVKDLYLGQSLTNVRAVLATDTVLFVLDLLFQRWFTIPNPLCKVSLPTTLHQRYRCLVDWIRLRIFYRPPKVGAQVRIKKVGKYIPRSW